ncbi:MAG: hypothetical protein AABZ77_07025 [Chloroflexota bacterium]
MADVKLELYDPTGAEEVTQSFAPRLADLNGKTIGLLSDGLFQAHRTFPLIQGLLQKRFPKARIIPFNEFGVGRAEMENEQTMARVVEKGCDAVITGNAA